MTSTPTAVSTDKRKDTVVVVGTLNVDTTWRVPSLPQPGATLLAREVSRSFGGKGANQAIAAARAGAEVRMIGARGSDSNGQEYVAHLAAEGINASGVVVVTKAPTGAAFICVDDAGENTIVVSQGANSHLDGGLVETLLPSRLPGAGALLTQLEASVPAAISALNLAAQQSVRGILNASPVSADFPWGAVPIDTLIVNEHECVEILGAPPAILHSAAPASRAALLLEKRTSHLVVTQGSKPTIAMSADWHIEVPVHPVQPVDTVGAGDTFAGVLATGLASGLPWRTAIARANVAAALSTLKPGAQAAMPNAGQIDAAILANNKKTENI